MINAVRNTKRSEAALNNHMNKDLITKTLEYCSDTGYLYYIRDMKSGHKCGDKAGYLENTGYIRIRIGGKNYQAQVS